MLPVGVGVGGGCGDWRPSQSQYNIEGLAFSSIEVEKPSWDTLYPAGSQTSNLSIHYSTNFQIVGAEWDKYLT